MWKESFVFLDLGKCLSKMLLFYVLLLLAKILKDVLFEVASPTIPVDQVSGAQETADDTLKSQSLEGVGRAYWQSF